MTHDEARRVIAKLLPEVWRESVFETPVPRFLIDAETVFDVIREVCEPPMTKEMFNQIADAESGRS